MKRWNYRAGLDDVTRPKFALTEVVFIAVAITVTSGLPWWLNLPVFVAITIAGVLITSAIRRKVRLP